MNHKKTDKEPNTGIQFPKGTRITPEWIRLPQPRTRCFWTGLSRSVMSRLTTPGRANGFTPPVRSRVLLSKGKKRGVRLVHYPSLLKFLNEIEGEGVRT